MRAPGLLKGFRDWLELSKKEVELQSLAIGMNSTVDFTQDKHIVMLDYDIKDLDRVRSSVREVQQFWMLSDAHIIKTRNGYHAYFFTSIVPYGRLKQIIEFARDVDPMYKYISKYYSHKTIRVAGKYKDRDLEFVECILCSTRPNAEERDLGEMKKMEFENLSGVKLNG